jgi:hypothetical protein
VVDTAVSIQAQDEAQEAAQEAARHAHDVLDAMRARAVWTEAMRARNRNGKAIVIGENMDRVRVVARALHAEYYDPPKFFRAGPGESIWKAQNRNWINGKMDEGVIIYDIGPAPSYKYKNFPGITSDYYAIERRAIASRSYPRIRIPMVP